MSLCRKDNEKKAALAAAIAADGGPALVNSEYELMLGRVAGFRRRLKEVKSQVKKSEVKTEILPEMRPYVEGVLEAATGQQDDNIIYYMIWAFDADEIDEFIWVAEYAIEKELVLPEAWESDLVDWVARSAAERTIKMYEQGETLDNSVFSVWALVKDLDMLDVVNAKMRKAMGFVLMANEPEKALAEFKAAVALNDKVGVKKMITAIEKDLSGEGVSENNEAGEGAAKNAST